MDRGAGGLQSIGCEEQDMTEMTYAHTGECLKANRKLFMINLTGQREKLSVKQSIRGWWNFKGKRKKEK